MNSGPPISIIPRPKRWLPAVEWLAENAYIPPGAHRLLAAGGLAVGLWGGRAFMDILTAKRADDGSDIRREQVPQMFRGLHGVLHYNPYSDRPVDRWKSVVDNFTPAAIGGVTAYYGGKFFFHGRMPQTLNNTQDYLHPLSNTAREAFAATNPQQGNWKISSATLDQLSLLQQSATHRKQGAWTYILGATTGTDKLGGFVPFNHNSWAVSFASGANIRPRFPVPNVPGLKQGVEFVNQKLMNNRSSGSVGMMRNNRSLLKWAEANLVTLGDPAHWLPQEAQNLRNFARDSLMNVPHATEGEITAVETQIRQVVERGWATLQQLRTQGPLSKDQQNKLVAELAGTNKTVGLIDQGMDRLLHTADPHLLERMTLGEQGIFTKVARLLGAGKHEAPFRQTYAKYLKEVFGVEWQHPLNPKLKLTETALLGGGIALGAGALVAAGTAAANTMDKRFRRGDEAPTVPEKKHDNILGFINDKPLDVAQWASRIVITPPSMHRLMGAAYLSAALFGGMKLANVLTGRQLPKIRSGALHNSELTLEAVKKSFLAPLAPLHGVLRYTPGSALPQDRLRQALHYIIPVGFGAAGTWSGSHFYFSDRIKRLKAPTTLEDTADRIALEQSGAFGGLTALTSVFNTGSGIHLLPFFNYSSNLQSRYVLGDGRQVATPGLGKWWSGNAGLTPWGVKRTLTYLTNYLAKNPDARPTELSSLVHSVIGKLYPDLPETALIESKQAVMKHLYEARDQFLQDGKIPETRIPQLKEAMKSLLQAEGFEQLLLQSGLDPAKANLANNGVSGKIANALGTKGNVARLQEDYRHKLAERLASHTPKTTVEIIAEHAAQHPAANDAGPAAANDNAGRTHAERLKQRQAQADEPMLGG